MTMNIVPYISAGPIKLGMSRQEVRVLFDVSPSVFLKDQTSSVETDMFDNLGIFVFYNDEYICIAIEMTAPSLALFKGINLLSLPFKEVKAFFSDDNNLEIDASGYTSYLYGIGAYYERKRAAETVIVFENGYYQL
jgi:hypothetical protein